jgi:hypothetical protein
MFAIAVLEHNVTLKEGETQKKGVRLTALSTLLWIDFTD